MAADQRLWLHDEAAARRRKVESVLRREHQSIYIYLFIYLYLYLYIFVP